MSTVSPGPSPSSDPAAADAPARSAAAAHDVSDGPSIVGRLGRGSDLLARSGLLVALVILFVALSIISPAFLSGPNLLNVLLQIAFTGIIACGMTLVIVAAEIDISVGSAVALTSALLGVLAGKMGWPLWPAVVAVLIEGTIVGLLAGWIRARFNVPSFIVTLALYSALRGMALLVTGAFPITLNDPAFTVLGSGRIAEIPVPALIMLATFVIFWFIATRTTYGRSVYAVGGNAPAARLSGINVPGIRISLFGITGFLSAVSGVLLSSRLASGNANIAVGYEFDVIAAVIIGGTTLFGGKGSLVGTFMGVLFVGLLANGMVLVGISSFTQNVVRGAVVLAAVLLSQLQNRQAGGSV